MLMESVATAEHTHVRIHHPLRNQHKNSMEQQVDLLNVLARSQAGETRNHPIEGVL